MANGEFALIRASLFGIRYSPLYDLASVKLHWLTLRPPPGSMAWTRRRRPFGDWLIRRDAADSWAAELPPLCVSLVEDGGAAPVKTGRRRQVFRVATAGPAGRAVYVKLFAPPRGLARVRAGFAGTPAEREWQNTVRAAGRGAPTLTPVAVGVFGASRHSAFVTEEFAGGRPLTEVACDLLAAGGGADRPALRRLADAVALALSRAGGAGVFHRDAHPGNVLVRLEPDGAFHAVFADLHAARFAAPAAQTWSPGAADLRGSRPMGPGPCFHPRSSAFIRGSFSRRQEVRALAQLDQYFHRAAPLRLRLGFLRAYTRLRGDSRRGESMRDLRRLAAAVTTERLRLAARLARQRDRRLRRNGAYFARLGLGNGWTARVALRLERRHVFPETGVPDRTSAQWRTILDDAIPLCLRQTGPAYELALPQAGVSMMGRRPGGLGETVIWRLTGSPGRRAFEECHRARHRDRPAELVLGVIERRVVGRVVDSAVLRPIRKSGWETGFSARAE